MKLMSIDDASKEFSNLLPTMSFTQKILILCKNHTAQISGAIQ